MVFGGNIEFVIAQHRERANFADDLAHVLDGVDHVTRPRFAFRTNHRSALGDPPQSLTQIARAADKWRFESMLIDMVRLIRRSEYFRFIDEVDANLLQNLRFGKVADATLRHHWDGNGSHDLANHLWRRHAGDAALGTNLRGYAFESHHCDSSRAFGNDRLLDVDHVHDHAAFQHLRQANFQAK
jgi:hypothetical protein